MSQSGSKVFTWQLCRPEFDPQKPQKSWALMWTFITPALGSWRQQDDMWNSRSTSLVYLVSFRPEFQLKKKEESGRSLRRDSETAFWSLHVHKCIHAHTQIHTHTNLLIKCLKWSFHLRKELKLLVSESNTCVCCFFHCRSVTMVDVMIWPEF